MKKKEYFAPKMEIIRYNHETALLSGSGEAECDGEYCDELGFNIPEANNKKV
jgi:hypothetical protein